MFTQPAPPTDIGPVAFSQPGPPLNDGLTPTGEQQTILDAYRGDGDLVVIAGAGTGKTSTLRMLGAAEPGRRCLYVAFNKAIADQAQGTFPPNVACSTAHSLAYRAVGHRYQGRLNGPRLPAREVARHLGIPPVVDVGSVALTSAKVARIVADTVRRYCYSSDTLPNSSHVPVLPGLDHPIERAALQEVIAPLAMRAWDDLSRVTGVLRFEHDHYLKIWALTNPRLPADVVMLDEAQDANPVIANIVAQQNHAQRVLVGDSSQAIYGWRGAVDTMSTWAGKRLTLSQSFRFGQPIADEANKWLDLLDAPLRLTGNPDITSAVTRVRPDSVTAPTVVLCRTNAGAIAEAMHAIAGDRLTAVVGDGKEIRRLAEAAEQLRAGQRCDHPELVAFQTWAEVQDYAENDTAGHDLKALVRLVDEYGPDSIIRVCDQLVPEQNADTVISTAHKAKGREWSSVRVAGDFTEPDVDLDDPNGPGLPPAEAMLAYVTVTRARSHLNRSGLAWVDNWTGRTPPPPPVDEHHEDDDAANQEDQEENDKPRHVDLPSDAANWVSLYTEAERNEKQWAAVKERAREQLEHMLGDAQEGRVDGLPAVSWAWSKPATYIDRKDLERDHPDIAAAYLREKKPGRPFKITREGT